MRLSSKGSTAAVVVGGVLGAVIVVLVIVFFLLGNFGSSPSPQEFTIKDCDVNLYENFWGNYKAKISTDIANNGENKQPNSITVTIRVIYEDDTYDEASTTYSRSVAPGETFSTNEVTIDVVDSKTVGRDLKYEIIVFWQGESWSRTFT